MKNDPANPHQNERSVVALIPKSERSGEVIRASVSFAQIEAEIARRVKSGEEMRRVQEHFENEGLGKRERLGIVREMLSNGITEGENGENFVSEEIELEASLQHLNDKIQLIANAGGKNTLNVSDLKAYRIAMQIVADGLSPNIIGEDLGIAL
ncbi:MAG: hypothetical protein JWN50_474 [Parcubacteria group bacterium]|nr:hypothetical protein [Parcubacteria group bacterium]